eukprot:scaffold256260_cov31-Tisochrysis_lutea.AAC.2
MARGTARRRARSQCTSKCQYSHTNQAHWGKGGPGNGGRHADAQTEQPTCELVGRGGLSKRVLKPWQV